MTELLFSRMPVVCPITGYFGQDYGGYLHRGVDLGCNLGTPVVNPSDQPAISVPFANDGSFGNAVCLDHPGTPFYTLYAHLSVVGVVMGQSVAPGQQLGLTGNTGTSTGPHLHWQLSTSAQFPTDIAYSRDPLAYLEDPAMDELKETLRLLNEALVCRFEIIHLGSGDYDKMMAAYALLKANGYVP